jgi:trimethylamine--corrinoid protein Co-methyltransferase
MLASFEVNDDSLALDAIRDAGIGGNFLAQPHTVAHMRREQWQPGSIFARLDYATWAAGGAKSAMDRAKERLDEILRAFPPEPVLEPDKARHLREIRGRAEAEAEAA